MSLRHFTTRSIRAILNIFASKCVCQFLRFFNRIWHWLRRRVIPWSRIRILNFLRALRILACSIWSSVQIWCHPKVRKLLRKTSNRAMRSLRLVWSFGTFLLMIFCRNRIRICLRMRVGLLMEVRTMVWAIWMAMDLRRKVRKLS